MQRVRCKKEIESVFQAAISSHVSMGVVYVDVHEYLFQKLWQRKGAGKSGGLQSLLETQYIEDLRKGTPN